VRKLLLIVDARADRPLCRPDLLERPRCARGAQLLHHATMQACERPHDLGSCLPVPVRAARVAGQPVAHGARGPAFFGTRIGACQPFLGRRSTTV